MKKFLTILMAGLLVFTMAACTANDNAGKEKEGKNSGDGGEEKVLLPEQRTGTNFL